MARKEWDAAECAKEVAKAFYERSTSSRSSTGVEVNMGPSPPLERAHLNKQALSSVARNEIDVCIISFHSPSKLHRLCFAYIHFHVRDGANTPTSFK